MILGIGIDLLSVRRIELLYLKFSTRLPDRILSAEEFDDYETCKDKIGFLAKRFCAKEAFSKALGTGIGRGINFSDITITNDVLGKPIITISSNGISFIENFFKKDAKNMQFDISITDQSQHVNCFVIISYNS